MLFKNKNYRLSLPSGIVGGDSFVDCNIMQLLPRTSICGSIPNLTFTGCNLLNCDVPLGSIVIDCLSVHKSFCSHLHPTMGLDACIENCNHVINIDEIWIDGALISTFYTYEDTII